MNKKSQTKTAGAVILAALLLASTVPSMQALVSAALGPAPGATVMSWPAPMGETLSEHYEVTVNGRPIPVYACRVSAMPFNQVWPGYQRPLDQTELAGFACWDMSGPVKVVVQSRRAVQSVVVRPASRGIRPRVEGNRISFSVERPGPIVVEVNGPQHALHLFASPPEKNAPATNDPGVRYFGPGVHHAGKITLSSNETVYLAGGAMVYGSFHASGVSNIRITGRGILDGSQFAREEGWGTVRLDDCSDVHIEGIVMRDPDVWCCSLFGCRNVTIANVKLVGLWRYNADGIDVCNSQNVEVRDSFVRAFDDALVVKGLKFGRSDLDERPVKNVRFRRCVVWCDWGRAMEIGAETSAPEIADIAFEDCDIVRTTHIAMDIQHGDRAAIRDIRFENIRVEVDDRNLQPLMQNNREEKYADPSAGRFCPSLLEIVIHQTPYSKDPQPGTVRGVSFRDITVTGAQMPSSSFRGFDPGHAVEGVTIENLRFNGKRLLGASEARLQVGPHVRGVRFVDAEPSRAAAAEPTSASNQSALTLTFEPPHTLMIYGPHLPGGEIRINYLEAYCRAGSTDADWVQHTVIPHRAELISRSDDRKSLRLRDRLTDGVVVEHTITAKDDKVDFQLSAHNPGTKQSEAHWAQACVRLADFTGFDPQGKDLDDYLPKCFIFVGGGLMRLSQVQPWAKEARYTPGQVWPAPGVPRADVNPRPLSSVKTDNGLIGAFSKDEKLIFATAWEPYQELFQGVARCLHSDLRLGGLKPGETKWVRGKIYAVTNDVPALLTRYAKDFPEHQSQRPCASQAVTSLANTNVHYTVPTKAYVVMKRGDVEAVVVDNRAVNDSVLPGHAAGYHGIASLRHSRQLCNLFVPGYAGLNFEHIHDGTVQSREILFEPRQVPMELRVVNEHTVELYQKPTPHWGLESCMRYELLDGGVIELTFECIPHRNTSKNGYIGLFWASYINQPESLDVHFRGVADQAVQAIGWQRGISPSHGTLATHRGANDRRNFAHDPAFPLELPFGFSRLRFSEPWFYGVFRGMTFLQMFRAEERVWFSQSPSGGGSGCPAWDFQWFISQPTVGERYQLKMRAAYLPLNRPGNIESVQEQMVQAAKQLQP